MILEALRDLLDPVEARAAPHDRAQVLGGRDPAAQGFPQAIDGAADKLKTAIESTLGRLRNY
jgi:hypothetical protein